MLVLSYKQFTQFLSENIPISVIFIVIKADAYALSLHNFSAFMCWGIHSRSLFIVQIKFHYLTHLALKFASLHVLTYMDGWQMTQIAKYNRANFPVGNCPRGEGKTWLKSIISLIGVVLTSCTCIVISTKRVAFTSLPLKSGC